MSRRLTEDEKPKKEAQREKMRTSGWRVAEKTQCVSSPPKTPEEIAQEQAQIYEQDVLVAHMDFVFDAYVHIQNDAKKRVIDTDNRDTKKTTDTICEMLGTTDGALTVSFAAYTVIDKNLAEGSYIFVSRRFEDPPNLLQVLSVLRSFCCNQERDD